MSAPAAIILAAGKSTRMNSPLPKVLHEVCGRPMIEHVLEAARVAGVQRLVVVVGHQAGRVRDALRRQADVEFALQAEQHGTGHAVMMCRDALAAHDGPLLVLAGDTPLLRSESLARLLDVQRERGAACVIGTAETHENAGLGRIVRDAAGEFLRIVEERDCTPQEAALTEVNTGCFAFDGPALFRALAKVGADNAQGEYYLTDCPAILLAEGETVVASPTFGASEALGVNTPEQLADVQKMLAARRGAG